MYESAVASSSANCGTWKIYDTPFIIKSSKNNKISSELSTRNHFFCVINERKEIKFFSRYPAKNY